MTPKERAERELRDFWQPGASKEKDGRRLLAIFTGAIRDAEEDAIERAAEMAASLDRDQYGMAGEVVAQQIRAMKHEPAK